MPHRLELLKEKDTLHLLNCVGRKLVSIYAPMRPSGSGVQQNRLRWKTITNELRSQLLQNEIEKSWSTRILDRVETLIDDNQFWRKQSQGLACFVTPDQFRCFKLRSRPEQSLSIGKRFNVRSLLPEINREFQFFVLKVDGQAIQLFQVDGGDIRELQSELPGKLQLALNCHQVKQSQFFEHRGYGDGIGGGQRHSERCGSEEGLQMKELAKQVTRFMKDESNPPLFFVGDRIEFEEFAEASKYQNLQGYYDQLDPRGVRLAQSRINLSRQRMIERTLQTFEVWKNSDWATDCLPEIYRGSISGSVKTLLVDEKFKCFGDCSDDKDPDFANGTPQRKSELDVDFVNLLVSKTILSGGSAYTVDSQLLPPKTGAIALFGEIEKLNRGG